MAINFSYIEKLIDRNIQLVNLEKIWPEIQVKSFNSTLRINHNYTKPFFENKYEYEISYCTLSGAVNVFLIQPYIIPHPMIHLNSNNTLCLFDQREYFFHKRFLLGTEIITWTHQWINLYELYLVNGNIWKGEEAPH